MSYKTAILNYAPEYWNRLDGEETELSYGCEEFDQIAYEVRHALSCNKSVARIQRIQNLHDLGQMLIREQLLVVANPRFTYYRVRRFIKVKRQFLQNVLRFNLDHRRCGLAELAFHTTIPYTSFVFDDVLIVVQVITSNPGEAVVRPSNNLEYFIDYVVHL